MKSVIIVIITLATIAVLFWVLLLAMGWLASFVGEGTYKPEAKTNRKSESIDEQSTTHANGPDTNICQRTRYEPNVKPVLNA